MAEDYLRLHDVRDWMRRAAMLLRQNRERLNELDSLIGDGDHGTNICRGFNALARSDQEATSEDIGAYFHAAGMLLAEKIGGSCGALLGLFFQGVASGSERQARMTRKDLAAALMSGLAELQSISGAQVGDKTMVDAFAPAIKALEQGANLRQGGEQASLASARGAESTKTMIAKHGRGRFLGERALGMQDAGATSVALLFQALWDSIEPGAVEEI